MSLNLRIECLPEPVLLFGGNATGVEPRRIMAKYGAADKVAAPNELRIGIVGPAADVQFARNWLPDRVVRKDRYSGTSKRASRAHEDELEFQRRSWAFSNHDFFRAAG